MDRVGVSGIRSFCRGLLVLPPAVATRPPIFLSSQLSLCFFSFSLSSRERRRVRGRERFPFAFGFRMRVRGEKEREISAAKGGMMLVVKQYRCTHSSACVCMKGHLSEDAIFLVFQHLNWNPRLIAVMSRVCKWFDEIAKRVLWKEFCRTRAPKMMLDLQSSGSHSVDGNWKALGKLLIYCSGCSKGGLFNTIHIPGHFVYRTRFSRTSGKSFLIPQCRTDVLYVSDPCEHLDQGEEGDVGFFRGVFKSFSVSRVRKMLIDRQAKFHPTEVCPYCKAKLWSMLQANMIPRSAASRLGAYDDCIEYYVCLNGHMLGICTLLPLSDSEEVSELE